MAAVDSGSVKGRPADTGRTPQVFSSRGRSAVEVQTYDFKRPERVSKDQMRALEALHEGFGRNFGAAISGYLRTIIEVSVAHIEQLTYSEFIHSLPNPTCFNLLKAEQLDGQLCLEIRPADHLPDHRPPARRLECRTVHPAAAADADRAAPRPTRDRPGHAFSVGGLVEPDAGDVQRVGFRVQPAIGADRPAERDGGGHRLRAFAWATVPAR